MKQKVLFIIFKKLLMKQIIIFFLEGESPTLSFGGIRLKRYNGF